MKTADHEWEDVSSEIWRKIEAVRLPDGSRCEISATASFGSAAVFRCAVCGILSYNGAVEDEDPCGVCVVKKVMGS